MVTDTKQGRKILLFSHIELCFSGIGSLFFGWESDSPSRDFNGTFRGEFFIGRRMGGIKPQLFGDKFNSKDSILLGLQGFNANFLRMIPWLFKDNSMWRSTRNFPFC